MYDHMLGPMSTDIDNHNSADGIVQLIGVSKWFDGLAALRDVTLQFASGNTSVVLGPSGCGKTVMLKHIIGLLKPDRGEVWFEGDRIDTLNEARLGPIRRRFGFLFQQGALFDSMSVGDNIGFPLLEHTNLAAPQRQEQVRAVLGMVGMTGSIDKMPAELSGGQRRRVALARAIVLQPKIILYDEPTTGLDPIRAGVINHLMLRLQREPRITSIVVTHDLASAFQVADVMVMLYDGTVIMQGTPQEFRRSPNPIVQRFLHGETSAAERAAIATRSNDDLVSPTSRQPNNGS